MADHTPDSKAHEAGREEELLSEEYRDGDLEEFFGCDPDFTAGATVSDHVARVRGEATDAERAALAALKEWRAAQLEAEAYWKAEYPSAPAENALKREAVYDRQERAVIALQAAADELLKENE